MKKYIVLDVIEDDFGCEELPEGTYPMVTIKLKDENGKITDIRMQDRISLEKGIFSGVTLSEEDLKM